MKKITTILSMMLVVPYSLLGQSREREIVAAEASTAAINWIKNQSDDTSVVIDRINSG